MAALKLYDYALTDQEVRSLCGPAAGEGGVAEAPTAPSGDATEPVPADGARGVNVQTAYFTWKPDPQAQEQTFYLDADRKAVEKGAARHTVRRGGKNRDVGVRPDRALEFGLDQDGRKGAFRCRGQAEVGLEGGDPSGLAWHEITWTYARDGGSLRICIDGRRTTTKSLALRAPPDRRLALGCTFGPDGRTDNFCGIISAVRLYDTALTDEEVGRP
jgi:hypothetical protein